MALAPALAMAAALSACGGPTARAHRPRRRWRRWPSRAASDAQAAGLRAATHLKAEADTAAAQAGTYGLTQCANAANSKFDSYGLRNCGTLSNF